MSVRKFVFIMLVAVSVSSALLVTSCPSPINHNDQSDSYSLIPSVWWGKWVRLDQSMIFYFGDDTVRIGDSPYDVESANGQKLSVNGYSMELVDDRTIKVTLSSQVFYLMRDRNAALSFSGTVASNSSARSVTGGVGGMEIIIRNVDNKKDTYTVTTEADGSFTVEDAIPGSTYMVGTVASTIDTQVEPQNDDENVGVITLTDANYSFKAIPQYPTSSSPFLFADGGSYSVKIRIRNDGSNLSPSPYYTLTASPGMTISSTLINNLQTIPAGGERSIDVTFSVASIGEKWKDFEVGVKLVDSSGKAWEDAVSFRFYRDALTLNFNSNGWSNVNIPVVIMPDESIVPASWNMGVSYRVPFATSGYRVVISGATMDTEMKYSIAVETGALDVGGFIHPNSHEPNNSAATATSLGMGEAIVSYLSPNELDYWVIDSGFPLLTMPPVATWESKPLFSWAPLNGADAYELQIASDSSFSAIHESASLGDGAVAYKLQTSLDTEGTWHYRIRARVNGTWGSWGTRVLTYLPIANIVSGHYHSLLLMSDGNAFATGYNGYGQLGDGSITGWSTPVQVLSGVKAVAAGPFHSFFLKTDGTLWAAGLNNIGQLGDGSTTDRSTPVFIMSGVEAVAAGNGHSFFLETDGTLWAAGYNNYGQLGDGTTTDSSAPVYIMSEVKDVAAGDAHSFFLKTDGTLWAAGRNDNGQLGDGSTTNRAS